MLALTQTEALKEATARLVKTAYIEGGWITPLSQALKGVTKEVAGWRPAPGVKSIWEITAHLANYLESLVNSFENKPPLKFNDWPRIDPSGDWMVLRNHVVELTSRLQAHVEALSEHDLSVPAEGKKVPRAQKIVDMAIHDAYHAGQIVKLRQLHKASTKKA